MNVKNYMLMTRLMDGVNFIAVPPVMGICAIGSRITLHSANVVSQRGDMSWYQAGYRYPTVEKEVLDE